MNCPICSTLLLLLREGKPPNQNSFRKYWTNLWGCGRCDKVFCPEFFTRKEEVPNDEDRAKELLSKTKQYKNWDKATMSDYRKAVRKQLSGNVREKGVHVAWPSYGNEIYVPTANSLAVGGLATIEESNNGGPRLGWTKKAIEFTNKHSVGYFICVEEHPGYEYIWEELAPMQEELKSQFGDQRAHVILPNTDALKVGDKVYLDHEYRDTEHYRNSGVTSEHYPYTHFRDLPDDVIIPVITYSAGGLATISRISADVDDDKREYYTFHTKERSEYRWYKWKELRDKQAELKIKFNDRPVYINDGQIEVRPSEYNKVFFELFGRMP